MTIYFILINVNFTNININGIIIINYININMIFYFISFFFMGNIHTNSSNGFRNIYVAKIRNYNIHFKVRMFIMLELYENIHFNTF